MSVKCCVEKIPKTIKKALGCDEKVFFKGTYDISTIKVTGNVVSNKAFICKNKNGYNFYNDVFYYTNTNELGSPYFSNETFNLTSYDDSLKKCKGNIVFSGLYPDDGSGGVSTSGVYTFMTLNGDGIYEGIKKVLIDTSSPIRQLYFCG